MQPQKVLHLFKEMEKKKPAIEGDYIVTEKLDGIYAYINYIAGRFQPIYSRQCRVIPAFSKYQELFNSLPKPKADARLIMEAYIPGVDFHTMNGIFNRSVGNFHCEDVQFFLHDIVYFGNPLPALQRYEILLSSNIEVKEKINVLPILTISDSLDDWNKMFEDIKLQGGEGVVLKKADAIYHPGKRNSSLMKIKLESQAILVCSDIFYTVGEKGHSNLNATFKTPKGIEVVCRIGKHADIFAIEKDKNHILGKKCLIEFMEELPSGMLREPRFKEIL
jgi:ATP-dependent DNA ligase